MAVGRECAAMRKCRGELRSANEEGMRKVKLVVAEQRKEVDGNLLASRESALPVRPLSYSVHHPASDALPLATDSSAPFFREVFGIAFNSQPGCCRYQCCEPIEYGGVLLAIVAFAVILRLLSALGHFHWASQVATILLIILAFAAAMNAFLFTLNGGKPNSEHVFAALSAYLLAGYLFALFYWIVEDLARESFFMQATG